MANGKATGSYRDGIGRKIADSQCPFQRNIQQMEIQTRLNRAEELLRQCLPYLPNEASRMLEYAAAPVPRTAPKETIDIMKKMYWDGAKEAINLQHSIEDFLTNGNP